MKKIVSNKKALSLGLMVAALAPQGVWAAAGGLLSLGVKGGVGLWTTAATDSSGATVPFSKYGLGYQGGLALHIGAPVLPISAEVDVFYATRKLRVEFNSDNYVETSAQDLMVPALVKFNLGFLFVGAGAFYSMGLGKLTAKARIGGADIATVTSSYGADSGVKKSGMGVLGAVGLALPLGLSLEARYNFGLTNTDQAPTGKESTKVRGIDVLAGLTF